MGAASPLFSICIPCFNHGQYVGKTVRSVLDQDFEDFEIVIADNASTDNSRDVIRSFCDPRIRLIENRYNIGFAPNLQQVTRHAKGRYINLLSSDDMMDPGALRTYAELIAQHRPDAHRLVLMSQAWEIDKDDRVFRYIAKAPERFAPVRFRVPTRQEIDAQEHHTVHDGFDVFTNCMQLLDTAGAFCSVAYSRQLWEAVEGYNSTQLINPDMDFIVKILRKDPVVVYVNRPLYAYRNHVQGQAQQQVREKVLRFQIDQCKYLMQYDEKWLWGTGVTPEQQRRLFVSRDCLDHALVALGRGDWTYASRLLAFAWSAYPGVVVRHWKSWSVVLLLALGPVGIGLSWVLGSVHKKTMKKGLSTIASVSA